MKIDFVTTLINSFYQPDQLSFKIIIRKFGWCKGWNPPHVFVLHKLKLRTLFLKFFFEFLFFLFSTTIKWKSAELNTGDLRCYKYVYIFISLNKICDPNVKFFTTTNWLFFVNIRLFSMFNILLKPTDFVTC